MSGELILRTETCGDTTCCAGDDGSDWRECAITNEWARATCIEKCYA